MKKYIMMIVILFLGLEVASCKDESQLGTMNEKVGDNSMGNTISIVEIPVSDLTRAVAFYKAILSVSIERMTMGDTEMGVLPANVCSVNVVLVKGKDYIPTKNGVLVYLNLGHDLQPALDRVEKSGGKILLQKTLIDPEMGYYALVIDSEGNRMGLHSKN
ncbi:VOC family protein [Leptospira bourretii]|uniref:VOC family protein n=1 Tax=Leptospira bourretii TaxID=2484962 RepID=A0A4V6QLK7_9LEPT|nr:VOC family protein [Leptospira bourretii]TGK84932.1 VOC family protein [Leptospira bourretii]TGK90699.1 VOC family protein [Leptospira bourretii]TGL35911.1 VOC family protein [Leptospira bourretii]